MDDGKTPSQIGWKRRPKRPDGPSNLHGVMLSLGVATIFMLATGVVTALANRAANASPRVGDIVHFDPRQESPATAALPVITAMDGTHRCLLNPRTIATEGGSFIVERLETTAGQTAPVVLTHWAGKRTAPGAGDCGMSAELTMAVGDLRILATAAGGYGAAHVGTLADAATLYPTIEID